ncbi:DIM1, 18S rRNA (adenine1779-N6/adenine1780-N6)-dimethyltransferase [Babesia microti strain RI]|uniref:rRNA adenine N(6)-methyltransferase n=1 Tax=Babesia microti (strain RI) TaxID=1133968 RepID=A0A1R4AAN1_BABMR|nr:DIM1, 18S rRNA (adenine1779-N6/adenine1780-N6)-dimethyltransferase [Babesia microti strain RI]SJK86050.1 DIM1, 18S rRNA (adenine1779-N6/adenine1780-N6)-dimethyltransferase [Babesia microti strain RI]|eukprot:XP_021338247.1 DIM1, 18S rRNA (adenine1779-N6/adenine1780-N6)-dimethyltransferase [Babesia microti strain RI]
MFRNLILNKLVTMAMRKERKTIRSEPYYNHEDHGLAPRKKQRRTIVTGNMTFEKKIGQHMLKNPGILDKIVQAAQIRSSDTVLEIGPGTGNLTIRLVPLARQVISLEIDSRMVSEVKRRCLQMGFQNLTVIEGNALRIDLPRFDVCTANLPYQISSPFVFKLMAHPHPYRCAILMFQKEFAERLLANVNEDKYGRLAINTRLFCTVSRVCKVSPGSFNPPPNVESMIVKIVPRPEPLVVDFHEWDAMIRICFSRKRRTLRSLLKTSSVISILETNYKTWCSLNSKIPEPVAMRELVLNILDSTGLTERRAITVSIAEFFQLLLAFNKRGIHFCTLALSKSDGIPEKLFQMDMDD